MATGMITIMFSSKGNPEIKVTGNVTPRNMATLPFHMRRAFADHMRANRTKQPAPKPETKSEVKVETPVTPSVVPPKPLTLAEQIAARNAATKATSPVNPAGDQPKQ